MDTTGITFILDDNRQIHTYFDLKFLQLAYLEISPPSPKRHLITDVLGVDGYLEVRSGPVRFENRNIKTRFEGQDQSFDEWCEVCSRTENALHGRHARVILDIDPDWYWDGFVTVTPTKEAIVYSEMEICIDVFPYKLKLNEYLKKAAVNNSLVVLINDRMPSCPIIVTDTDLQVNVNGNTYELKTGRNEPEFELIEGSNVLEFTGSGNVEISWRGGSL